MPNQLVSVTVHPPQYDMPYCIVLDGIGLSFSASNLSLSLSLSCRPNQEHQHHSSPVVPSLPSSITMKLEIPKLLKSPRKSLSPRQDRHNNVEASGLREKLPRVHLVLDLEECASSRGIQTSAAPGVVNSPKSPRSAMWQGDHKSTSSSALTSLPKSMRRFSLTSPPLASPDLEMTVKERRQRRRSSLGHVPASTSQRSITGKQAPCKNRRRSSMGHVSMSNLSASLVSTAATCSPKRRTLRRLGSLNHVYDNAEHAAGHRHVLQLQASWQAASPQQRTVLAEAILWQLTVVSSNSALFRQCLGITSFRSPQIAILATLLVDTLEALVSHAGPDLWQESFAPWRVQWTAQGLSGSAVAAVLETSLREAWPESTRPATVQAWQCTVVPVLQQWD